MKLAAQQIVPALLLLLTWLLPVYGCKTDHAERRADIRGEIKDILVVSKQLKGRGIVGFLRIEGNRDTAIRYHRADLTITDTTDIFTEREGSRHALEFDSIRVGQRIEAFFTGPVLESYPVHATAKTVVIVEERK